MNLVEKLLKADKTVTEKLEEQVIKSKKLAKVLGEEEVEIVIQEIPPVRFNEITSLQYSDTGELRTEKIFDVHALLCVEGMKEPNLKDEQLMQHFGCSTPKDLAIKLFKGECSNIATKINKMCLVEDDVEKK